MTDSKKILAWTRDAIAEVEATASLGKCPDWGHCTPDCHHDEPDGITPQAAERQAQLTLWHCAGDRELLELHGGSMHSCPAKDDTGYLDEWTQFGYGDTCPVVQRIAEGYGWTDAGQKAPFQRMAEIAARVVAKTEAVDQTEFALAPSPTGYDGRADLARLRARLAADRDRAARNAQHAHTEQVRLVGDGIVAGLDTALRWLDDVLGEVDRSCGKPRAGGPAQAADRP
ncbi:hypothetical protein [Streptomyces nigrescens]|uniref:Uncharacterized protein n=1 Tax=Streptomyces nigrescens TaxID=1920 RepID=A0A640TCS4_STRNI|nr:hypothetical protein [Streptomyces libani]WAT94957.1 hypothetical protein STRLI_000629 [Streptomyces libani subsp. libani]GFE20106.1 hypothetical protein Sliba_05590 [Streptomyces libani subsp. libani]GGV85894.1 hypothetical protein GCM10010500_03120 [Streptomyces libani subsp. libani]